MSFSNGRRRDDLNLHLLVFSSAPWLVEPRSQGLDREFLFLGGFGAIPQNILVLCVIWYLCFWLYRRKIFLKMWKRAYLIRIDRQDSHKDGCFQDLETNYFSDGRVLATGDRLTVLWM